MPIQSQNPATGEIVKIFKELSEDELNIKLEIAEATFEHWRENDYASRATKLLKAAEILKKNARSYAELATLEMGKPIKQAIAEVEKCAWVCEYYAKEAENMLKPEQIKTEGSKSYVRFDPLGIVLAVMPWNFPFWQVFRFIAPASMAGNVGLLKHASNVPQCAAAIEEVFSKAGFPEGVFQNLYINSSKVESVIRDPRVKAVTLTGSEWAGRKVAEIAGDEIKHSVLELGGSDPFIVLADANVEEACSAAVNARLQNNGQSCIAAKRFIVVKNIAEKFIDLYIKKFESLSVGDPMNEGTDLGPLINEQGLKEIQKQVNDSVAKGARILYGGKRVERPGYFFEASILGNVVPGMPAYEEEIFGPVASIMTVKDTEEALRVANNSRFGLGASLWTSDMNLAEQLAARLQAGAVFINSMVKSDPRLPFGGTKKSGYGRELSHYGIKEFVNIKTVWMK